MASHARWRELQDLLEHVPVDDRARTQLLKEMSRPERLYHGVKHLELLWRRHRQYAERAGLADPAIDTLVACAIAYHDSVYDSRRSDNEKRSAEAWMSASEGSSISQEDRRWVERTILATKDHLAAPPEAAAVTARSRLREKAHQWMLDLDLTPLGDSPEVFDRNTRLLRAESGHLSDEEWTASMLSFGRIFLDAPHIYQTPTLAAIYESAARGNLARHDASDRLVMRDIGRIPSKSHR
jgi:predicted metal-dependent HD superfamily phosphohydrolase